MDFSKLWDAQVLIYAGLTCTVVLIALIVLALTNRQVRFLASEMAAMRRDMKLIEEGVDTVTKSLERMAASKSVPPR